MLTFLRLTGALLVAAILTTMLGVSPAAAGARHGGSVGDVPDARTPHVLDNRVLDIEEVGDRIVVAGSFTRVRDADANGAGEWDQPYVFAFDRATGAIDRNFAPKVTGQVNAVAAGPGGSVYLGGSFFSLNGEASRNLVNVSLATGERTGFRAPAFNGAINDLVVSGDRLFVAGIFNTVGGVRHGGLATLAAATGALDEYMGIDVLENASYPETRGRASVGVSKIDVSPDATRLVAIGNFRSADGLPREQAVVVLLEAGAAVVHPNWRTRLYEPTCSTNTDTYVRDVEFAPDGSFFSIVTTGGGYAGTLCDTAARWDTAATGLDVRPTWTAYTGGDTLLSVAITDTAVYVGGHQRWMNNPTARDAAGRGAVPRPGLAALDPRTGVPLSWNPGRNPRGYGAEALLATSSGLYVGMDTEYFGNYLHLRPRLGFFPLAEGAAPAPEDGGQLPGQVVLAGRTSSWGGVDVNDVRSRSFDGTTAGTDITSVTPGTDWSRARGAFRVGEKVFYGYPGTGGAYYLFSRTFDGAAFGPATMIDPYNDPFWSTKSAGRDVSYRGMVPSFYGQLSSVTAMAYRDGRLYYTRSGYQQLFYRYFSVDSGIVSEDQFVAASSGFGSVAGLILSGDQLYVADSVWGTLRRVAFVNGAPSGSSVQVSGMGIDNRDWRTRAMFLGLPANQPPTAAFTPSCLGLVCTFDAQTSTDADGRIVSYDWDFGDGTRGTGATVSKSYDAAGDRTVRLTVTDDRGMTASTTQTVTAEAPAPGVGIALRGATETAARAATSASVTVPASVQAGDGLVMVLSTNSTVTGAAPAGWRIEGTQVAGSKMTTQVFSRVASAADAGSTVTVPLSGQAIVTLQLAAYSGTDVSRPVTSVTGLAGESGTAHTTPVSTVSQPGSWVVSVWSDKQGDARSWTAPARLAERSSAGGEGRGDIATLLADSGAGMPTGPAGGLTATVSSPSNLATMLTVVLAPGDGSPAPNALPEAQFSSVCAELVCTIDATGSRDPDGSVASYDWDLGNGQTATGPVVEHTFTAAGDHEVTLTVTDDRGGVASTTQTVTVATAPAGAGIAHRAEAEWSARAVTSAAVTVPDSVRAGDGLVLVLSSNSPDGGTAPDGWRLEGAQSASGKVTTQVFSRVATAADAGSTVTVPLSGQMIVTLQLTAYSGTDGTDPVASVTGAASGSGTAHTTPVATVAEAGSWVMSVWSDKQADARTWTAPAGVVERASTGGEGRGDVATLLVDRGGPVAAGDTGGLTATVSSASNLATTLTVVLAPGDVQAPADGGATPPAEEEPTPPPAEEEPTPPPAEEESTPPTANQAPEAVLTSSCAELVCSFDGTGSADPDGSVAAWAWTFGDGRTATGPTSEHTFAAAGDYEVTLTVTDDQGRTATATATVPVAAAPPAVAEGIGLRGSAGTSTRTVSQVSLTMPDTVQVGDGLVLVLSTNSTVTGAAPAGWTEAGSVTAFGANPTTQVFQRVAGAGDAGSDVTVVLDGGAKVTLQLLAYSGTDTTAPVSSVTGAESPAGTSHTTPEVADVAEGSWVLSVWSDKQADARTWTAPAGTSERSNVGGVGNGDVATLVADSGGPVPAGRVGGLTATVPTPSNRAATLTIVLGAAG